MTQASQSASKLVQQLEGLDEEIRGLLLWPWKESDPEKFRASLHALRARRSSVEEQLIQMPTTHNDFVLLRAG